MNIKVKFLALALSMLMLVPASVKADEGMWLLSLIGKNYDDMKQKGFKLTADDIYNINQSCREHHMYMTSRVITSFVIICCCTILVFS